MGFWHKDVPEAEKHTPKSHGNEVHTSAFITSEQVPENEEDPSVDATLKGVTKTEVRDHAPKSHGNEVHTSAFYKSGDTPTFAGAIISGGNLITFGNGGSIGCPYTNEMHIAAGLVYIDSTSSLQSAYGYLVGVDGLQLRDYGGGFYLDFENGDPADLVVTGNVYAGRDIGDTDFDVDDVLTTVLSTSCGTLIVKESTVPTGAEYFISGSSGDIPDIIKQSVNSSIFSSAKNTANKINVYLEGGYVKVQNKHSNNLNVRVGFFGL